jgi:hypothetical protein
MSLIFAHSSLIKTNLIDRQYFIHYRQHFIQLTVTMVSHAAGQNNFWPRCTLRLKVEFHIIEKTFGPILGSLPNSTGIDDQLTAAAPV